MHVLHHGLQARLLIADPIVTSPAVHYEGPRNLAFSEH
jgi:hypothetical protein